MAGRAVSSGWRAGDENPPASSCVLLPSFSVLSGCLGFEIRDHGDYEMSLARGISGVGVRGVCLDSL